MKISCPFTPSPPPNVKWTFCVEESICVQPMRKRCFLGPKNGQHKKMTMGLFPFQFAITLQINNVFVILFFNNHLLLSQKLNEEPLMQLVKADPNRIENPPENGIRVTWLGHASVLFQLDNVNILANPNFSSRGIRYYHPGDNARYRKPVYEVQQLPRIDAVLISNTHFDHLDLASVRALNERFGEMLLWYVPAGLQPWMSKAGCVNVVELEWWREDEVDFIDQSRVDDDEETKVTKVKFVFCPSQNHHTRSTDDDNAVLWGSWAILTPRYKLFYVGGTGYCEVFKSIGRKYGPFHMAALPIGGYEPEWKFGFANCTPEEAVKIHQDLLAMCSLAISWGTFSFSNEVGICMLIQWYKKLLAISNSSLSLVDTLPNTVKTRT